LSGPVERLRWPASRICRRARHQEKNGQFVNLDGAAWRAISDDDLLEDSDDRPESRRALSLSRTFRCNEIPAARERGSSS
jgi:hypothetical protein